MRIIAPISVTDAILSASNIVEDDAPAWDSEATYQSSTPPADRVVFAHRVYESAVDNNTGNQPDAGAVADPPTWLDLGPTNRYRMFDGTPAVASQRTGNIDVTLDVAQPYNAVGLINVSGIEATVQVIDPDLGVLYERTQSLEDLSGIDDWHDHFFAPRERKLDVVFLDLPTTAGTQVRIVINAGGSLAKCGEAIIGAQRRVGDLQFDSRHTIRDFSTQTVDQFGAGTLVKRGYAKRASFPISVETSRIASVLRLLAQRRAQPTLFVGTADAEETIVYGTYKTTEWTRKGAATSFGSIECESLAYEEADALFEGASINTPSMLVPEQDEALPVNGVLRSNDFATTPAERDTHVESDWQIASDAAFSSIVHESLADASNLTSYAIPPATLTETNTYYVRKRDRGQTYGESPWSAAVRFTAAPSAAVDTPSITVPTSGATHDLDQPFTTSAFATTPAAADTHAATDWQIATDAAFTNVVWSSLYDTENLTSRLPPYGLPPGSTRYVRARHHGRATGPSAWPAGVDFVVGAPAGEALISTPGTHEWVVPAGITAICAVLRGGSGSLEQSTGTSGQYRNGGGGGALRWINAVAVTPGETLIVEVGAGGVIGAPTGGHTRLLRGATELLRAGGAQGRLGGTGTPIGGNVGGGDGGDGGVGLAQTFGTRIAGGGGGVGGYSGPGGPGATYTQSLAGSGSGGAAAGGGRSTVNDGPAFDGGSVGLYGEGASGVGDAGLGDGGSAGTAGAGGAGGSFDISVPAQHVGGDGAARIIWGAGRAFPSTNVS